MESVNKIFTGVNSGLETIFNNKLVSNLVLVFLMLYISLIAPPLPEQTEKILDNGVLQLILIILIGYIITKNLPVVVVSTVALIITLQMMKVKKFDMNLVKRIFRIGGDKEKFEEGSYQYENDSGFYGLDIEREGEEVKPFQSVQLVDEVSEDKVDSNNVDVDVCGDYGVINNFSKLNPNEDVLLVKRPVVVDEYYTSLGTEYSDMIVGARKLENYGELN